MKKSVFFLLLVLALTLSACTAANLEEYTYTKELNGTVYTINPNAKTITDGNAVYPYTKTEKDVTVIYPNGARYERPLDGTTAFGTWYGSKPADAPEGWELVELIMPTRAAPKKPNGELLVMGIVALLAGVFNAILPKIGWFMRYGWTFENPEYAEPSHGFVIFGRVVGVVMAILGVVGIVMSFQ